MKTEYEVKILEINVPEILKKLDSLGATKIIERNMKRNVYRLQDKPFKKWMRLRDEGNQISITIKEVHSETVDGTKETEIVVDDFNEAALLLEKLGFVPDIYSENRRTSFELQGAKIELDFWPRVPPFLEVEADSEKKVKEIVELLGYTMEQTCAVHGDKLYGLYGIDLRKINDLRFEDETE